MWKELKEIAEVIKWDRGCTEHKEARGSGEWGRLERRKKVSRDQLDESTKAAARLMGQGCSYLRMGLEKSGGSP